MLSWVLGWLGEICCCSAVSAFQVSWHFPQTASNVVSLVRMLDIVTIICQREVPCSCLAGCQFLSVAVGNVLLTLLFTPLYLQCLSQLFLLSCTSLGLVSRVPVCHSHANLFYSFFPYWSLNAVFLQPSPPFLIVFLQLGRVCWWYSSLMLSIWFLEVLASSSSNSSPNLFLNLFHVFDFLIHVADFITCVADFFPLCIADFSLWALDWIYLFICVLFQAINHFNQTTSEIFIWQLPGFSMPERSACGEWSCGGARLRAPSCFLLFRAVIWMSAGLDFSSGVWEGACYCTVCSWRLCPQYHWVRRKWSSLGSAAPLRDWRATWPEPRSTYFSTHPFFFFILHLFFWPLLVSFSLPCEFPKPFHYFWVGDKDKFSSSDSPSSKQRQPLVSPFRPSPPVKRL